MRLLVTNRPAIRLLLAFHSFSLASSFSLPGAAATGLRASFSTSSSSSCARAKAQTLMSLSGGAGGCVSAFLQQSRAAALEILKGSSEQRLMLVMGNEACDADSLASAVVLAYAASMEKIPALSPSGSIIAPIINIPRDDLALRQDVVMLLREAMIDAKDLLFYSELPEGEMRALVEQKRIDMVLTDHNKLGVTQQWMGPAVTGVVDHHEDTGSYKDAALRVVDDKTGSCCTLVAKEMVGGEDFSAIRDIYGSEVATLLGGALVLDTRLFKGKCTETDAALGLGLGLASVDKEATSDARGFFERLSEARSDVRGLTSAQKLRKDYKRWGEGARGYGIATIPCSVEQWAEDDGGWVDAVRDYADSEKVPIMLTMHTFQDAQGGFRRELTVHGQERGVLEELCQHLGMDGHEAVIEATGEGSLKLTELPLGKGHHSVAYSQGNLKASRKQVQPAVDRFMSQR